MDVQRLRVLRELDDRGTVTAVAHALSFTPSAVSQQLRALERETGVALLERDGRRLRLTDAGRALVARSHDVLAAVERAEAEVEAFRTGRAATVRLGAFPSFARILFPGVLARASATPGLEVACRDVEVVPATTATLLADHDVVVAHRDEGAPPFADPRIEVEPLVREPVDVVVAADHPLAAYGRVAPGDLAGERLISVEEGLPVDDLIRSLGARTGVELTIAQRINDFRVTEAVVAAGEGVALLPRYVVDPGDPRLARRPLAGVAAARLVEVLTRAGTGARPAVRAVVEGLHDDVRALVVEGVGRGVGPDRDASPPHGEGPRDRRRP